MRDIVVRPTQGYLMLVAKSQPTNDGHHLCGQQTLAGAVSPNSGRPLLQLAQFNTKDPRLELATAHFETLPLLYSWTCDIQTFTYRVGRGVIALLDWQQGRTYTDFPYENYPAAFPPLALDLVPIDAREQQILRELNDRETRASSPHRATALDAPRHQVGGIPRLMQDEEFIYTCPICGREMPLFATIADNNGTPRGFVGNPFVQVIYHVCRDCWVIRCYNLCD